MIFRHFLGLRTLSLRLDCPSFSTAIAHNTSLTPVNKKKFKPLDLTEVARTKFPTHSTDSKKLSNSQEVGRVNYAASATGVILPSNAPDISVLDLVPKTTDFLGTLSERTRTNMARYLSLCRVSHMFADGRGHLESDDVMSTLSSNALMEASRLLVEASTLNQGALIDAQLASQLDERRQTMDKVPPFYHDTLDILLGLLRDPSATITSFLSREVSSSPSNIIWKSEILMAMACRALEVGRFDQFIAIMTLDDKLSVHDPRIVYWLLQALESNKVSKRRIGDWYLKTLSRAVVPLTVYQFENFAWRIFRSTGSRLQRVDVDTAGNVISNTSNGNRGKGTSSDLQDEHLKCLPSASTITQDSVRKLGAAMLEMVKELAKGGGSMTEDELSTVVRALADWRKSKVTSLREGRPASAVVVDTLNVTHTHQNRVEGFSKQFWNFLEILQKQFGNILLVTRPGQAKQLRENRPELFAPNSSINIITCHRLSEDDLVMILAALSWGADCFVISNDQFQTHLERMRKRTVGSLSLNQWYNRRVLPYDRATLQFDKVPSYSRSVTRLSNDVFYLPVHDFVPLRLPVHTHYVVHQK